MNAPQFYVIRTLPILFILTTRQRNNFVICKYFFLYLIHFSIIFNSENFPYSFEASFYNTDQAYYFCRLTELVFTEIWLCFAMRGLGHLTNNFVTQILVAFVLSQG